MPQATNCICIQAETDGIQVKIGNSGIFIRKRGTAL